MVWQDWKDLLDGHLIMVITPHPFNFPLFFALSFSFCCFYGCFYVIPRPSYIFHDGRLLFSQLLLNFRDLVSGYFLYVFSFWAGFDPLHEHNVVTLLHNYVYT